VPDETPQDGVERDFLDALARALAGGVVRALREQAGAQKALSPGSPPGPNAQPREACEQREVYTDHRDAG
jgi:hypothetical protein